MTPSYYTIYICVTMDDEWRNEETNLSTNITTATTTTTLQWEELVI